uniref:Histone deacetylase HDT2 isoform X6 n=1 Tax=Elaeis guineensis var. tenera TaxID=51953 RepID=A0A6I9SAU7_ELAGV|nr:histone deacetylase HDT2 isoform X6 [Elaeis guineensis]
MIRSQCLEIFLQRSVPRSHTTWYSRNNLNCLTAPRMSVYISVDTRPLCMILLALIMNFKIVNLILKMTCKLAKKQMLLQSGKLIVKDEKGKPATRKATAGNKGAASSAKPKTKREESIKADKPKADEEDDDEEDDSEEVSNEDEDMAETLCDSDDEDEDEDSEEADEATPKKAETGKRRPC